MQNRLTFNKQHLSILWTTLLLLLFTVVSRGQSVTPVPISGHVTDKHEEPVAGATVVFVQSSDSTQAYRTMTDSIGCFSLSLPPSIYVLRISSIGYHTVESTIDCTSAVSNLAFILGEEDVSIGEVTVSAKRITYNSKGYVANIQNDELLRHNTLSETLELLPGLSISDGKLLAYRQEVLSVFVNNKKVRLSGGDLLKVLSTYNSKDIRKVEVLNSTADPEVRHLMGYVLKITTKGIDDGGQLNISLVNNAGNTRDYSVTPQASLQQTKGKWSLYLSPDWTPRSRIHRNQYIHTVYESDGHERDEFEAWSMTIRPQTGCVATLSYDFSPMSSLMLTSGASYKTITHLRETSNTLLFPDRQQYTRGTTEMERKEKSFNVSLDYNVTVSKFTLMASATYSAQQRDVYNSRLQETSIPSSSWSLDQETSYRVLLLNALGVWSAAPDHSFTFMLSHTDWDNTTDSRYATMPADENTLRYKEHKSSAVATYSLNKGILSMDVGLQLNHIRQEPVFSTATHEQSFGHNYTYLLPSLSTTFSINRAKGIYLTLRYGRDYAAPDFSSYDTNQRYDSEYQYSKGITDVASSLTDEVRLQAYMSGWSIYGIGIFRKAPTQIYGVDSQGMEYTSYGNDSRSTALHVGLSSPRLSVTKKWTLTASTYYQWDRFRYDSHVSHGSRLGMNATSVSLLPLGLTMTLRCSLMTRYYTLYERLTAPGDISLRLSRSWLNDALTLSMSASYQFRMKSLSLTESFTRESCYTKPQTQFSLTLRYRINWGNRQARAKQKMSIDTELLRMNN